MAMSATTPESGGVSGNPETAVGSDNEIGLLDLLRMLWEHKGLLIGVTLGTGVLTAVLSLFMPNYYTATARVIPPQQNSASAAALLGQLSGLAAVAGGNVSGIRNPNDLYVGMMKSRTVGDRLVERFSLVAYFDAQYSSDARGVLEQVTRITSGRDGIVSISVEVKDPKLAADLANGYIEELVRLTGVLALTEASQRRIFFERQLLKARENLTAAEVAAREALTKGGLAVVEGQGRSLVEASARLRAQITAKDVQISAMRSFAADSNPDLQLAQRELSAFRTELARVEGTGGMAAAAKSAAPASDNVRLLRELRYQETLQELLARQTEAARLDEARDMSMLQVLDTATIPDRKSGPKRSLITVLASLIVFSGLSMILFVRMFLRNVRARAAGH